MNKEKGQVVVILLLIVMISLAIALSVVGRSVNEISTANKTEQSSRAFSAAEAGIERSLNQYSSIGSGTAGSLSINDLSNKATAAVAVDPQLPTSGSGNSPGQALEYPSFGKEAFAQFWLADPSLVGNNNLNCNSQSQGQCYNQPNFWIYFGDFSQDYILKPDNKPAIEVNIISQSGSGSNLTYTSKKYYYDSFDGQNNSTRNPKFAGCITSPAPLDTTLGTGRRFYCKALVPTEASPGVSVLVRVKFVYTNLAHPLALAPNCTTAGFCSLPPQVNIYKSVGKSGNTQRTIQLFRQKAVMPNIFDFALLSAGELDK